MSRSGLLSGAVAAATIALALAGGTTGSAQPSGDTGTCSPHWRAVATGPDVPLLTAVAAITPTDVWAVGGNDDDAGTATPVIAHWDGRSLRSYRAFAPSARNGELTAVAAVSSTDAWAVGVDGWVSGDAVAMHWDGRAWRRVPTPEIAGGTRLMGLAAFASTDVWAVGSSARGALVMHWDGRTWSLIDVRGVTGASSSLTGIAGASPNDVWAVGNRLVDPDAPLGQSYGPLALHWDGRTWHRVPAWETSPYRRYEAIDARTLRDVWLLAFDGSTERDQLVQWRGRGRHVSVDRGDGAVNDLAAFSARGAWAVGSRRGPDVPLLLRWDGASWRRVSTAVDSLQGATLEGAYALSATDVWAVGSHLVARYTC